jgi:hypothetical protein
MQKVAMDTDKDHNQSSATICSDNTSTAKKF